MHHVALRARDKSMTSIRWLAIFTGVTVIVFGVARADTDLARIRGDFLKVIDRPAVPLAAESQLKSEADGVKKFYFTYASDAGHRVPGILWVPQKSAGGSRLATVIVLHGTGGNKESEDVGEISQDLLKAGFAVAAIDAPFHGERTHAGEGPTEYNEAIFRAWKSGQGHPFYFDTVWDVMRLVDYLSTRSEVDASRIGLTGFSKGGIETYLTAAVDPRIATAVPCIGVQSFHWALENHQWRGRISTIQDAFDQAAQDAGVTRPDAEFIHQFYQRVAPGLDGEFDGPAMLPLIATRPLLVINGDSDDHTPVAGVRQAVNAARPLYIQQHAGDKLQLMLEENTPHRVTREARAAAVDWFVRWLKPEKTSDNI